MTQYAFTDISAARTSQLAAEIQISTITVALDYIELDDTTLNIYFKADLSEAEEATLEALVTAHEPEPNTITQEPVLVYQLNTETGLPEPMAFTSSEGRNRVLASTKPVVPGHILYFYWTGAGDDISEDYVIPGAGDDIIIEVAAEDTIKYIDLKFGNYSHGELVYLAGGAFQWEDTVFGNFLSCYVMASPTPVQQIVDLNFNVDQYNRLYAVAPGTGTHGLAGSPTFIQNFRKKGYWDLSPEWTPVFRPDGEGLFDWFIVEREVARFVNRLPLFGTESKGLQMSSPETSHLPPGCFVRVICHNSSGNAWKIAGSLMMYREVLGVSVGGE